MPHQRELAVLPVCTGRRPIPPAQPSDSFATPPLSRAISAPSPRVLGGLLLSGAAPPKLVVLLGVVLGDATWPGNLPVISDPLTTTSVVALAKNG